MYAVITVTIFILYSCMIFIINIANHLMLSDPLLTSTLLYVYVGLYAAFAASDLLFIIFAHHYGKVVTGIPSILL